MVNGYVLIGMLSFFVTDHHAMDRRNGTRGIKSTGIQARLQARQTAQSAMVQSIIKQDPKALEIALRNPLVDPNKIADDQLPPIVRAMHTGEDVEKRRRMVQILLKYKADPNIPSHSVPKGHKDWKQHIGLFPLHVAVSQQDPVLVAMLLQAHARVHVLSEVLSTRDPEAIANIQSMPLHYACSPGMPLNFDIVRMLVRAGAGIHTVEEGSKQTPLHLVVANGNLQAIAFLLKEGACSDKVNASGFTSVHEAVMRDDICAIWLLCKETQMNHCRRHPDEHIHKQIMALTHITDEEQLHRAQELYKPYYLLFENYTPLHFAITSASLRMLQELLILGADPNSEAFLGVRPIHLAVFSGDINVTQEIRRERVRALLAAGADLNVQGYLHIDHRLIYVTPLLLALRMHFYDLVDDMCSWYAHHKRTIRTPHISYMRAVLKSSHLSFEQQYALIQKFIALDDDLAYENNVGNMLHIAVASGADPCMIEHLIRLGIPADQPNKMGLTPLDVALTLEEKRLIDCLKPYAAARLSQLHTIILGDSAAQEQEARRMFDSRIGDITRLHEYMLFFKDTPGIRSIMKVLQLCGTEEALKKYEAPRKQGAINTARGALFELNAAYHLMLERYEITSFRAKYGGLEFDIETPEFLVECKNINWSTIVGKRINELKDSLQRHNEVVKRIGKKYLFYSRNSIPKNWQTWLAWQDIAWVEYKDIPSPSQNKIREQHLMPLVSEQTAQFQKTSSSYQ
jgi:ankyrin repeat protein